MLFQPDLFLCKLNKMTSYWGPLGWMTLHSASMLYSEKPSDAERILIERFVDLFGNTISCFHCKTHFLAERIKYVRIYPDYLNSKKDFMLFVFRIHNIVNKRLDKPILQTVEDSITVLKNANSYSSLESMRNAYLSYLQSNWGKEFYAEALAIRRKVQELIKINNEYLNPREIDWSYKFEDNVLPPETSESKVKPLQRKIAGFKNGKLIF